MKLHAFETGVDPRIRAYTRDRGRKRLQHRIALRSFGIEIEPKQWRYVGVVSTTGLPSELTQPIHGWIRERGFAIVRMPLLRTLFHVFDLQLDRADLRIYSHDKDLKEFNAFRRRLELSPDGDRFAGGHPILRGELEIPTEASATALKLSYRDLQDYGFEVVVVGEPEREEALRRLLQRELPDYVRPRLDEIGVKLVDLQIHSVTFHPPRAQPETPPSAELQSPHTGQGMSININNSNVNNPVPTTSQTGPKPQMFDGWIAKLLGVLAAIATIVALFKS